MGDVGGIAEARVSLHYYFALARNTLLQPCNVFEHRGVLSGRIASINSWLSCLDPTLLADASKT